MILAPSRCHAFDEDTARAFRVAIIPMPVANVAAVNTRRRLAQKAMRKHYLSPMVAVALVADFTARDFVAILSVAAVHRIPFMREGNNG
jgi:hypothetical protein